VINELPQRDNIAQIEDLLPVKSPQTARANHSWYR
jgi:hypothetical protein